MFVLFILYTVYKQSDFFEMGQTISINKRNIHKTHRFTDKMYEKLNYYVSKNYVTTYEKHFAETMEPVFENTLNIPVFYCMYTSNYCIIARRLNNSRLIEAKAILYNDEKRYKNFTKGYAKLVPTKISKIFKFSKT